MPTQRIWNKIVTLAHRMFPVMSRSFWTYTKIGHHVAKVMRNSSNAASKVVEMSAVRWSKVFNIWQMKTTCSSLACCLGQMLLQCRLNNALCPHWKVISFFIMHPITHWEYSAVWCAWYSVVLYWSVSMNAFGRLVRSRMCFTTSQICLLVIVISKCEPFSVSMQQAFLLCKRDVRTWCSITLT